MTDVEGASAHSAPRSVPSSWQLWRARRPAMALLAVSSLAFIPALVSSGSSQAATVASLQAQATQLEQQIQSEGMQISALGQKYDEATNQLASIENQITATEAKIAADKHSVYVDQVHLRSAAIDAYVTDGSAGQANPLFSGNQRTYAAAQEYGQVATGNLDVAVANLHTAQIALNAEQANLASQKSAAQGAVNAAAQAQQAANQQQGALEASLAQTKGQLATAYNAALQAANNTRNAVTQSRLGAGANFPPPPSSGGAGGRAVAAAESQLGVPYVWAAEDPGRGFDCSGLTAWAWGQAGVSLSHYSGAQMAESAPVPVSDLEPGDLLFYGPGGSEHVAMYIGSGEVIQAPYTGTVVSISGMDLGDGFAGAGRP